MAPLDKQLEDRFAFWVRAADVKACGKCGKKPVLLPKSKNDVEDKCFWDRCYGCAEGEYRSDVGITFIDALRSLLTKVPQPVYLFNESLPDSNFSSLKLECSAFLSCDLTRSSFHETDLSKSNFLGSKLNSTTFSNATLEEACMLGCILDYGLIKSANLKKIVAGLSEDSLEFIQGQLSDNWLKKAWEEKNKEVVWGGDLTKTWCLSAKESNFSASNLTDGRFIKCELEGTAFNYTRLQGVDFTGAQLQDSSLSHVSFGNTTFDHARLARVDLTSSYTPDPLTAEGISDATVCFDHSVMHGSILRNCYFLRASFENVKAQRIDCSSVVFGPGSVLSGDFSNSRFVYAYLAGCDLGNSNLPIVLRDTDFSHAQFIEISINAKDLTSAIFARSRFEDRKIYNVDTEKNDSEGQDRDRLFVNLLESKRGNVHTNNVTGGVVGKDECYIEPAAINFNCASIGTIRIKNISFLTADFTNSVILMTSDSKCSFKACNFDNAVVVIPDFSLANEYMFESCTFRNGIVAERSNSKHNRIMRGCAFDSTAFRIVCEDKVIKGAANAANFVFIDCTFEQTPLDKFFKNSLGNLILKKCRFVNGQYLGLYSQGTGIGGESEKNVHNIAKEIIKNTTMFKDPSASSISRDDEIYADRQFLWNMLASNFRLLAIPGLESKCLCELKDLDLLPSRGTDHGENANTPMCWLASILTSVTLFVVALFASSLIAGLLGPWLLSHNYNKLLQPVIASIVIIVILAVPVLLDWVLGKWQKKYFYQSWAKWQAIYSKSIYYYGEKPFNAFFSWLIIILIFGCFYWGTGLVAKTDLLSIQNQFDIWTGTKSVFSINNKTYAFLNSLYFSAVTFTTLGFGDLQPLHLTKFYAALEACIGAVMMALFVLCFARRTAAR